MPPDEVDFYQEPGSFTRLDPAQDELVARIPADVIGVCDLVQGLVIQPTDAEELGLPIERQPEREIRRANELIAVLASLDPGPIAARRPPEKRVIGTCRHFVTLSCALLRYRGIAARARCGFSTYFVPDLNVDHWIIEYWHRDDRRWVRVDTEILGLDLLPAPDDLPAGEFLTGGEAWTLYRQGEADPVTFGVYGTDDAWGPAEIRGNAIRDLAALNKVEMLPWDSWGRMEASYDGETGADYDELIDAVASVCASEDLAAIRGRYASDDLPVPPSLLR